MFQRYIHNYPQQSQLNQDLSPINETEAKITLKTQTSPKKKKINYLTRKKTINKTNDNKKKAGKK